MRQHLFFLFFLGVVSSSTVVCAATLTVDLNGGADFTDIQSAIDAAKDGDAVLVKPGEYLIAEPIQFNIESEAGPGINPTFKDITLRSEKGPAETLIRSGGPGVEGFSSLVVFNGETSRSILEGFTLMGCRSRIFCEESSVTIRNCLIRGNTSSKGGGIYCVGGSPTIANCEITGNFANYGGGIACESSYPSIEGCEIHDNVGSGILAWGYEKSTQATRSREAGRVFGLGFCEEGGGMSESVG